MGPKKKGIIDRLISHIGEKSQGESEDFTFEDFEEADEIVVTTNLDDELKRITDTETIHAVLEFLQGHRSGWIVPWEGVPIASRRLNFYVDGDIIGNVGFDIRFLTTHQFGSFWSKDSDMAEYTKIRDIVGLSDEHTD